MKILNLPNVTLCAISSVKIDETVHALTQSMKGIGYAKVILITDQQINLTKDNIDVIHTEKLGYDDYSHFVLYKLKNHIDTDFVLLVQHDGYVLRPNKWDNRFFDYDYIGAPWPKNTHFTDQGVNIRVGNGGFSLRSKKLLEAPTTLNLPFTDNGTGFFHEDGFLCSYHRAVLEQYGIVYAPVPIASRFSRERWCSDSVLFPFGFHNGRTLLKSIKKLRKKLSIL